jgi:hypothetical protein
MLFERNPCTDPLQQAANDRRPLATTSEEGADHRSRGTASRFRVRWCAASNTPPRIGLSHLRARDTRFQVTQ